MGHDAPDEGRGIPRKPRHVSLTFADGFRHVFDAVLACRQIDSLVVESFVRRIEQGFRRKDSDILAGYKRNLFPRGCSKHDSDHRESGQTRSRGEVVLSALDGQAAERERHTMNATGRRIVYDSPAAIKCCSI